MVLTMSRFAVFAVRLSLVSIIALQFLSLACGQTSQRNSPDGASTPPLRRYLITPETLPPPFATPDATNPPRIIPQPPGAKLNMPPGFKIDTYAEGFKRPREIALAPNGDVFVADSEAGQIIILRDANGDGKPDQRFVFASGLLLPYGIAFWRDYVYIGTTNAVLRFRYRPGQTRAEGAPEKIADLPGRGYREHWTRNLIFSPDGRELYVTVGSETNVSVELEPMRAAITEFNPDGTGKRIFASGLRNPIGLAFNPVTGKLWAAVQERDRIGDDLVPDYVTEIKEGAFYGWPFAYIGQNEDPRRKGERPDLVQRTVKPDVLIQAHSAVMDIVFYDGKMFPAEYRGDAFVSLHGSWNRSKRTGYKIVRIRFKDGRPVDGSYEDFITGWMLDEDRPEVWGRPVGLLVLPDGSLLIVDDGANKIWRVTYNGPR
ncbi:PQQ-dependent sugar dehydrogenase [Pyrinomonas methylaliphatogenes]|nr:sorbosone dehydrogenase family protein [Pyrinomonas methylaliphatogenes]